MSELINNITASQDTPGLASKYTKKNVKLRVAALELAARENARVPQERRVSSRSVLLTVERSLNTSASLKPRTREFLALKHVASFLALAIDGKIPDNSAKNTDLLPVGHPLSTRAHRMSEAALNSANARWFAADPRIDDSVRELVASAYESPLGSIEYRHSVARINALTAGLIPQDVLLSIQPTALTAAGGNSTAARSARANMQRRDRNGQFAFQGGGFSFFLRGLDGKVTSVSGRFVANSDTTDGFQIEVKKDKVLKDGLYDIPASKAEAIIAVLPDAPQEEEVNLPSGVEAVDLAEITPLDAPAGWELVSSRKPGEAGPDKVFKSGDGYIVEYYEPGNESTKSAASSAWKSNYNGPFPTLINSNGETGLKGKLQSDQPVYILKRDPEVGATKSGAKKTVAITQSWADTQNEAGKDEKSFDDDVQAKIDQESTIAKNNKAAVEKLEAAKAEKDKANQPIFEENAKLAESMQSNLDSGKDANGNALPEGWTANKKEINPTQVDSQGNAIPIDVTKAVDYSKEDQGIKMSVSQNEDGSLNFNGQSLKSWDAVVSAEPDYVKGKIDEQRNAVKEAIKGYDQDGKVADIIDAGGGAYEINAELENNSTWKSAQEDLKTSAFVELPSANQKESWAKLEKINSGIYNIPDPYNNDQRVATLPQPTKEDTSVPNEPSDVTGPKEPDSTPVSTPTPEYVVPNGAYKLQSPEDYEPQGRDGEDSTDFSDDPEILSGRSEQVLSNALMQALIGVDDPTKDLIAELDSIDEDVPEDDEADTKKKPGPKKKKEKSQQVTNATGYGSLEFNQGEEYVPAEAIYNALKNKGVDVDMLVAQIYDSALGDSTNVSALTKGNKEDSINAQSPTPALDEFDGGEDSTLQDKNVYVASPENAAIAVMSTDDFRKKNNGEPNAKIVDIASQIRTAEKDGKGHYRILEDNIALAFSDDPQDKEAFQALWGLMTQLDYGYSSNLLGIEGLDPDAFANTELVNAVSAAIGKYNGSAPTGDEVDAFILENGTYNDFLNSKVSIVDGDEEVGGDSLASGYYRLIAENSRYNDTTLYRGIQVPRDSEELLKLTRKGNVVSFDGRPFSDDSTTAGSFAGVMYAGDNGNDGVIFSIAPTKGKAADAQQVSPYPEENELSVLGSYQVTKVSAIKQPSGRTLYKVTLEKLDKRGSVLEGYDSDYEPLLIQDNASPTMPDGYYEIGTAAYTPMSAEDRDPGLPEDFDDSPLTIARMWEKADLAEVFRLSIENGTGKTILTYPDGYDATIDAEAVRDALQIQGVDTNSLLEDIANAAPDAGVSNEEMTPAEANVETTLDSIIEDASSMYDISGWKKVGPQLGSNEGGMAKSPDGDQYYVKTPKSELHAQNETLAAALYRVAGVDAAEVYMGEDENGKLKTLSPDIIGKQDLAENLNNPEYLAKLQDGFAIDAWLGNWDVAGLEFDNVMSNENGDPVRVDPGGALLFRAMGAPKGSLFGSEVNELDTLRDPNMNPQSYKVFGSMTDEQQKESARKLLDISNEDIEKAVDAIVTNDKAATELKDKLIARRKYILDRYDLSADDSSQLVDSAGEPDVTTAEEDVAVQSPEAHSKEVDSRLDVASGWAEEYATDKDLTKLSLDRKIFATIAEQIDVALKDWRNGEISDEDLPGVLNELDDFIDTFTFNDESADSNAEDLQDQLRSLKTYIDEYNKENGIETPVIPQEQAPAPSVDTPVDDIPDNPYKDSQGTPIVAGQKLRYKKNDVEMIGTFARYDKSQQYVVVNFGDGKKPKAISTKYLTVVNEGGGGKGPKAPEAPESPEPSAPETPTPDITPDEDIEPETETDIGQFDSTDAQLTKDGKVRVSFIVDGNRPFNPMGDGPAGYEEVLPYVVASKLDVDGVDEVTVEVPLDKMDDFVKTYQSLFREKLDPAEFFDDIYTDYQEMWQEDDAEPLPEPEVKTKEELAEFSREGWDKSVTPNVEIFGKIIDNSNRIIFDKKNKDGGALQITVDKSTLEDPTLREGLEDLFNVMSDLHKRYPIDGLVIGINNANPEEPGVLGTTTTFADEPGQPPVITINKEALTKKRALSVEIIAAHEYGHALDPRNAEEAEKGLEDFKALMSPTYNKFPMTEYGLTSGREAFAEAFAAFYVRNYGKPFDPDAPKTPYTQSQKVFQNDKFWENTIKHFKIEELATQFERSPFTVEDTFDADNPATLQEDYNPEEDAPEDLADNSGTPTEYIDEFAKELARTEDLLEVLVDDEEITQSLQTEIENTLMPAWMHVGGMEDATGGTWTDIDTPPEDVVKSAVSAWNAIRTIRENVIPSLDSPAALDKQLADAQDVVGSQLKSWNIDPKTFDPNTQIADERTTEADAEDSATTPYNTDFPFGEDADLNKAATDLTKTFQNGMPEGGKVIAVNEQSGMIAVTPDGETVYIFDGKKNTNYTTEGKPDYFEPGGAGEVFKWRPLTTEEDAAMTKKIADNSVPYGQTAEDTGVEGEDADAIDSAEEPALSNEPPAGEITAPDANGKLIWSGMEITDKDGNTGTVIKVNKDAYAFVKFPDGTVKWRSAKTVKGTGSVSSDAKNLPIAKTSSKKATGAGVPPVKVENPSDWTSTDFADVPSLTSAIEKTLDTSDKRNAARGASAAVDSDSIEDLDVRFTHEINAEGKEILKAKFKLTNWAAKARIKEILAMSPQELAANGITIQEGVTVPHTSLNSDGLIVQDGNNNTLFSNSLGRTYTITTSDGVTIKIQRANKDDTTKFIKTYSTSAPRALHNLVTIEAPADASPEMIASAIQNAGVADVRPAVDADARILKENRLMSIFDAKTDANVNLKGTQREESLQRIKDKYGITVDDVEVSVGNSGRIETRLTAEGAEKIVKATGSPVTLRHTLSFRSYQVSEKAKVLFDLLTNPHEGLLSTSARWSEGSPAVGQSSVADIGTGGADYVFTKPVQNVNSELMFGPGGQSVSIHFDPVKMYQRLDFYANADDKFGKRFKANDVISSAKVGAYEVMFKGRVGFDLADRIVVTEEMYKELMPMFAAKGITTIAGRPIADFIVKPTK